MEYVLKLHRHTTDRYLCAHYIMYFLTVISICMCRAIMQAVPLMIKIYGNLQQTRCWLLGKCSLLVLEYITNPFLVLLCGFAQYETERLQYVDLAQRRRKCNPQIHVERHLIPLILQHKLACYSLKLHAFVKIPTF